ncbi:DNA polymerase II large subunit [Candidatus Woesearchaeota archaeon]|nr:DNA polymerase II large subunit [Candidatus Woesearchaeota archaeon]
MEKYFKDIENNTQELYKIATAARAKGLDPENTPSIVLAKNMPEKVEGLISTVAPQLKGKGMTKRIRDLEKKYGFLDWRISLILAEEIANEKFCKFKDEKEAMEIGIRAGFAYHTLGTVASPLEGFVELKIRKRKDGKKYMALFYSGPIRSAGGTGASVSVLIADYVRKQKGYEPYDPTEEEIKRYSTELYDYHDRITNLQYLPSPEEIEFLAKHIPVQIDGGPSEKIDVSNYKDLSRVETNKIRNGVCLTMGEGLAQKAPKVWKQLSKWGHDFGMDHWDFLEKFIDLQKKIKSKQQKTDESQEDQKIKPDYTFIKDLVAGRPVLTHPLAPGGFRLRYGRSRTSGYSATSLNPATMAVLNKYIATGTQLKLERPGKATTTTPCETIDGPIVKLKNGSVLYLHSEKEAQKQIPFIQEILFLGDILINYGDFLNRAHPLVPPGYCPEWWIQELEKKAVDLFGNLDVDKLSELLNITTKNISHLLQNPLTTNISSNVAINISKKLKVPLHPQYTYHWNLISLNQMNSILNSIQKSSIKKDSQGISKIIINHEEDTKRALELIGVPHLFVNKEFIVIEKQDSRALMFNLGLSTKEDTKKAIRIIQQNKEETPLNIINKLQETKIRDKSGVFIGARMGRPEKAKIRKLTGSPHTLFPVGDQGGRLRSFQSSIEDGTIRAEFPTYFCKKCDKPRISPICEFCGTKTIKKYNCKICGTIDEQKCKHGENPSFKIQDLDIKEYFNNSLKKLKTKIYPDLIKGVRGTSNKDHIPEPLIKGILRAEHPIYVNKDGTTRYDMTQLPLTHFKPKEIETPIEKLKEMGYDLDIYGKKITSTNQLLELKPQDIILPKSAGAVEDGAHKIFLKVAKYIDNLLVKFYGLKKYYNLKNSQDLAGHLVAILAPHTSAGIIGRIVGFSKTQGLYCSPVLHAATRRDCDGDEACAILLMDAFLNFSRQYLPAHRGSTQDAPLILSSKLIPAEVDDMIFDMDVSWKYPLEFYEATQEYKNPWDVKIPIFKSKLNTPQQYYGFGFTHPINDINSGVTCSAYKTLPSMEEKLKGQMILAEKIRAVDEVDVARIVIEKHFIKDIRGNLRKFSTQTFRCVHCNEKYRRPPLVGKCTKCGGKVIFTVSEGSILKYLNPTISLSEKYNLQPYLKQSIALTKKMITSIFGEEKEKQTGLGHWFG